MVNIPGYQIVEKLHESARSLVDRGLRNSDKVPVILKSLLQEYPTLEEIAHLKLEYDIIRNLDVAGVIKTYGLEKYQHSLVMVLEDFGGQSLNRLHKDRQFTLEEFLTLAIQVTEILGEIHSAHIIHKDVNPSNIVVNLATQQVKIIDFGISTVLSRENPSIRNPNVLEGTLAYMSPEQTGRMNRAIDYRTDFYSLGATFYQLLCDRLPFEATDAVELVHCHLALAPIPPYVLRGGEGEMGRGGDGEMGRGGEGEMGRWGEYCPKAVSDIVMKLLAKNAEERYQSAWGIKADLQECLNQLKANGKIEVFPLAQHDVSDKFQISQKLYGREREIETLLAAFERVGGGDGEMGKVSPPHPLILSSKGKSEMMLVSGYSGVGKSALVQEICKPITRQKGYFLTGKFGQFQRSTPYAALIQAFQTLIQQLLTESESQITLWREKLLAALGINAQIIIDVIPEVELLLGKQPTVVELPPAESQNRFNLVFQNFVSVFTKPEHPLVIFLDDLQWADSASLKLIQLLMTAPDLRYLLLIGAYRDNEVSAAHPLMLIVDAMRKAGAIVNHISLLPLDLTAITQIISDTLNFDLGMAKTFAELLHAKTNGNPFFIKEFLNYLEQEQIIYFDVKLGMWQCNFSKVSSKNITDNVADLLISKIEKLSSIAQNILRLAACLGHQFDSQTLSFIREKTQAEIVSNLWEAVQEGLILPIENEYKYLPIKRGSRGKEREIVSLTASIKTQNVNIGTPEFIQGFDPAPCSPLPAPYHSFKFLHDRIQQAAYSLITEPDKKQVHLQIGQMILKYTPEESLSEKIFDIVNHLNIGAELINEQARKDELAQLNLMASKKAKSSVAYETALKYLNVGRGLLGKESWLQAYDLTLALHVEAAEAAYLNGDFEQMERLAEVVQNHAKTLLDKVKIYEIKIQACIAQNKLTEAIKTALEVLKLLGVKLPPNPQKWDIVFGLVKTKIALAGKRVEELVNLPKMTDPYKLAAMRIIASVCTPTYFIAPHLWQMMVFQKIQLSLKYGNAPRANAS